MDYFVLIDKDYFINIFEHVSNSSCISKYLITLLDKIPFISLVFTVISLNAQENEEIPDVTLEEETDEEEEKKRKFDPLVRMPKWLRIILMFLPAFIYTAIILLVDHYVGFPDTINPMALIAIPGIALFFLVVVGDMVYRNFFMYKMLRSETRKTRVYRQIIKERKEEQSAKDRYEYEEEEDEYDYDDDDEEYEETEDEDFEAEEEKEEYVYDAEDELTEDEYYRMKSYLLRGGIMTILLVNAIVLLGLAALFQLILGEGFIVTS
ncbi:MAG: hypothetical protein KAJ76_06695 [Candidatus Heimdallarchaeota archaeon]|nr:hypothetical protein [Candidatus Heimdallarchaeota archaeon]